MSGYQTEILSNGSKWAGEKPDTIATLVRVLDAHPLARRRFQGRFIEAVSHGRTEFRGNFLDASHVFCIRTDDPIVVRLLTQAIRRNRRRANYRSQSMMY